MIWIGRLIILPLGTVLLVVLLLTLFTIRVSDTFLNTNFYVQQINEAGAYEFALNDLLVSILDEVRDLPPSEFFLEKNPILTSGLSTDRIIEAINRAVPPEYLEGLVEQSIDQFVGYLAADRDEFELTIRADEQIVTIVDEIKLLLGEADVHGLLYDEVVVPEIRTAVQMELPLGTEKSMHRLVQAGRRMMPPEWVQSLVEDILDEITPYITGESDTFEVYIRLSERMDIALLEIKSILRDMDAADLLYVQVIEPAILESLGETTELWFGVAVMESEILDALHQVVPPEWVEEQVELVIGEAGPYLIGRTDEFSVEISLVDNKDFASGIIEDLVDEKLFNVIDDLPECGTVAEEGGAIRGEFGRLPVCVPANVKIDELIERSGIDIGGTVQRLILDPIPNVISFSETQIYSALSLAGADENIDLLDRFRRFLRDGCVYTEHDLVRPKSQGTGCPSVYAPDISDFITDARSFLSHGFTYTHIDFRRDLEAFDQDLDYDILLASSREDLSFIPDNIIDILDMSRDWIGWINGNRWALYLTLSIMLVTIGFLGGRGWSGRLIWAASFLFITSAVVVLGSGPMYGVVASSWFDEQRQEVTQEINGNAPKNFPSSWRLVRGKGLDMAESVADDFMAGIRTSATTLMIIAITIILATVFKNTIVSVITRITSSSRQAYRTTTRSHRGTRI